MASPNSARQYGDEYQQLVFWKYALMMLNNQSEIEKIGFEYDKVKSFDDIVIMYSKPQKFRDSEIKTEYIQVKFHMRKEDFFTIDNLVSPSFINAPHNSLLDNVVRAYRKLGDEFANSVFTIYSIRDINQNDVLYELVSNVDGAISLEKLFDNTTDRSRMGKIRTKLQKALNLSQEELKAILKQIKIRTSREGVSQLREYLNQQLNAQGLQTLAGSSYLNPYCQLLQRLAQVGKIYFSKDCLDQELKKEKLYIPQKDTRKLIIRSYDRNSDHDFAEERNILKLEQYFDNRFLKAHSQWDKTIYPLLKQFIEDRCSEKKDYQILLDASPTIAFMSGRLLDMKTARKIDPIQRTEQGLTVWEKKVEEKNYPEAICNESLVNDKEADVAVAIGFSRDIFNDVKEYLEKEQIKVGKILNYKLETTDSSSVIDGNHAWQLANQIKNQIDKRNGNEKRGVLHIFMACPNAIVFILARNSLSFGKVQLYEHDFLRERNGSYYPTAMLPFHETE